MRIRAAYAWTPVFIICMFMLQAMTQRAKNVTLYCTGLYIISPTGHRTNANMELILTSELIQSRVEKIKNDGDREKCHFDLKYC